MLLPLVTAVGRLGFLWNKVVLLLSIKLSKMLRLLAKQIRNFNISVCHSPRMFKKFIKLTIGVVLLIIAIVYLVIPRIFDIHYPGLDYDEAEGEPDLHALGERLPTIVILTVVHNSETKLVQYKNLLQHLSYPHNLISVIIGDFDSTDETPGMASNLVNSLDGEFRRAAFYHLTEFDRKKSGNFMMAPEKHGQEMEIDRRSHLASARNVLMTRGLEDEDWVMWLDIDIKRAPRDLLQRMLKANKTIIAPQCLTQYKSTLFTYHWYDLHTWRETEASLAYQATKKPKYIFLEGYNQPRPKRIYLGDLYREGDVVRVDGVGACALLVKADHHRRGLNFPAVFYKNQIESEGLGLMAQDMKISVWGMPRLAVLHS